MLLQTYTGRANHVNTGIIPLNMCTSRKGCMGKYYVNTKWIPTLLDKD